MKIYNLIHFEFFSINHNFIRSVPLVIHFEEKITCIFRKISKSPHRLLSIFQASIELATYFSENQRAVTAVALCLWCEAVKSGGMSSDISSREMTNLLRVPLSSSQAAQYTHNTEQTVSLHSIFSINFIHCIASGLCSPLVYYLVSFHHCSWASSESCLFSFPSSSLSFSPTHHTSSPNIKIIYKKTQTLVF